MARVKPTYALEIMGEGVHEVFRNVVSHTFRGLPATTYINIQFANGEELDFNDFGVRSVRRIDN
jgi:hypothetical protein